MIYVIGILVAFIILLLALNGSRKFNFDFEIKLSGEDVSANVKNLALNLRNCEKVGVSPDLATLKRKIVSAHNLISKKIENEIEINDYERWLYDNYFYIKNKLQNSRFADFSLLPHKFKQARIMFLADFIVKTSNYALDFGHISKVIKEFNEFTPLQYDEISNMPLAIEYALALKLAKLSARVIKSNKYEKAAKVERLNDCYSNIDTYLYFWQKQGNAPSKSKMGKLKDVNFQALEYSYLSGLVRNSEQAKNCISGFRYVEEISLGEWLSVCPANDYLSRDETYKKMDIQSKMQYLRAVNDLSYHFRTSEKSVIDSAFGLGKEYDQHFGCFLFEHKLRIKAHLSNIDLKGVKLREARLNQRIFVTAIWAIKLLLSTALSLLAIEWMYIIPTFVLLLFALHPLSERIVLFVYSTFLTARPIPKLDNKQVPQNAKTLVAISHFITDEETLREAIFNAKKMAAVNVDKNLLFCLLIDYKGGDSAELAIDHDFDKILNDELMYEERVSAMVRKRVFDKEKFVGHERKRGAITAMNQALISGDFADFRLTINMETKKPQFVVLLDSDSEVTPGFFLDAINTILHPLNEKYDLLAFKSNYNLSSLKTVYSKKFLYNAGKESYGNYSSLYFNLCGKEIFCGKGIYRLDAYYSKLKDVLPDGKVLSHDIIEGAILNTGSVAGKIYEDAPQSFLADCERSGRWQRGDIQLLPFIKNSVTNNNKKKIVMKKPVIYNYIMINNAFSGMYSFASLILLLFAFENPLFFIPFAVSVIGEGLINLLGNINQISYGAKLSYVFMTVLNTFLGVLVNVLILPLKAVRGFLLFFATLLKMIQNKKLLQWKTFKSAQGEKSFSAHLYLILPTLIVTLLISLLFLDKPVWLLYATASIIMETVLFYFGKTTKGDKVKNISQNRVEILNKYAEKTYDFFKSSVSKENNFIGCDNIQILPKKTPCEFTSATNIGFTLLSHICADRLGFDKTEVIASRIKDTIETIIKLKKYKGNLYNWYYTSNLEVAGEGFVSSIDSANFLACLIICKEFLKEKNSPSSDFDKTIEKIEKLIKDTKLNIFYNNKKGKFSIGIEKGGKLTEGVYDLLASEARILAYLGVVKGENLSVWESLGRDCVRAKGDVMLSWSGTMFEYMLPQIFFPNIKDSLIWQSCSTACKVQFASKCKGVFGISESGYYKFDAKLNYQYYAFGIKQLALRNSFDRCVISPYSSFLALEQNPKKVCDNLKILEGRNMLGKYGFFEAIDYTNGKNIVYSYMTHHQGMSLAAICNFIGDNYLKKLFCNDEKIAGGLIMLSERKNTKKCARKDASEFVYAKENEAEAASSVQVGLDFPSVNTLANERFNVVIDDCGTGYCKYKDWYLNRFEANIFRNNGSFAYFIEGDEVFSSTFAPIRKDIEHYQTYFTSGEAKFTNTAKNVEMRVLVPYGFAGEVRCFRVENTMSTPRVLDFAFYTDLMLNRLENDLSHRAFENLFVKTEFLAEENTVVARRDSRHNSHSAIAGFCWGGIDFEANTNKAEVLGRLQSEENPKILGNEYKIEVPFGDVIEPCFAGKTKIVIPPKTTLEFFVCQFFAESEEDLQETIKMVRSEDFIFYAKQYNGVKSKTLGGKYLSNKKNFSLCNNLVSRLLYECFSQEKLQCIEQEDLFNSFKNLKLNKEIKAIYYRYGTKENLQTLCEVLEYIKKIGINFQLVIDYGEDNKSNGTIKTEVDNAMQKREFIFVLLDRFLTSGKELAKIKKACFRELASSLRIDERGEFRQIAKAEVAIHNTAAIANPAISLVSGNGGFGEGSDYFVTKIPALPYSNVVAGKFGGFVATENGGGFSYFENSRESKLTTFSNLQIEDTPSEEVFLCEKNNSWRINKGFGLNSYTQHSLGKTRYVNGENGIISAIDLSLASDGKVKIYEIELENTCKDSRELKLFLCLEPCLGWRSEGAFLLCEKIKDDTIAIKNILNGKRLFLKTLCGAEFYTEKSTYKSRQQRGGSVYFSASKKELGAGAGVCVEVSLLSGAEKNYAFAIGGDMESVNDLNISNLQHKKAEMLEYFKNLNKFKIKTPFDWLDTSINYWTMYQVVSARLNGRCGFYQTGGAIGFRDQLQDCLAMLFTDKNYVREHILNAASHQFLDGDVQHWWHHENFGVKTKISDDKIFLPYVLCEYIKASKDLDIIDMQVPYLKSLPIEKGEEARLWNAEKTEEKESIYLHAKRAIDSACVFGEHGLPLIGCGDWNDALNAIGLEGRGESVWLGMFLYLVIQEFMTFIPCEEREKYAGILESLKNSVAKTFEDGRFKRAFTDKGEWLGSSSSRVCSIDILSQAFSVISGITDPKTAATALSSCKQLINMNKGYIKLLDPPFDNQNYCGYISAYPNGIRENGGQYTHATMWYIKALAMLGKKGQALKLLALINPIEKCKNEELNIIYKGEPYVISADIYSHPSHDGRCGWSWYTGSAAWYYKVVMEDILGIKITAGGLLLSPNLPAELDNLYVEYRSEKSLYKLTYKKNGKRAIMIGRIEIASGNTLLLPLYDNKDVYEVTILY